MNTKYLAELQIADELDSIRKHEFATWQKADEKHPAATAIRSLIAANEALSAKNTEQRNLIADQGRALVVMHDKADLLSAELASVRADAERYRWLTTTGGGIGFRLDEVQKKWDGCDGVDGFNKTLDAARSATP